MTEFTGEVHPFADYWPMLEGADLASLVESIKDHGLRFPATLTPKGVLADGRNRLLACQTAGVEPRFVVNHDLIDDDAVSEFIQSANAERHHISPGAHAMYRARLLHARGKRKNGRWKRNSLPQNSEITGDSMHRCGFILDWAPHLAPQVVAGTLALDAAYQQAKAAEDEAKADERAAQLAATGRTAKHWPRSSSTRIAGITSTTRVWAGRCQCDCHSEAP